MSPSWPGQLDDIAAAEHVFDCKPRHQRKAGAGGHEPRDGADAADLGRELWRGDARVRKRLLEKVPIDASRLGGDKVKRGQAGEIAAWLRSCRGARRADQDQWFLRQDTLNESCIGRTAIEAEGDVEIA